MVQHLFIKWKLLFSSSYAVYYNHKFKVHVILQFTYISTLKINCFKKNTWNGLETKVYKILRLHCTRTLHVLVQGENNGQEHVSNKFVGAKQNLIPPNNPGKSYTGFKEKHTLAHFTLGFCLLGHTLIRVVVFKILCTYLLSYKWKWN